MSRFTFPDTHGDLLGAHISTKGGLHTVFDRATEINASAIALFAKNSNQWKGKAMTGGGHRRLLRKAHRAAGAHARLVSHQPRHDESRVSSQVDRGHDRRARSRGAARHSRRRAASRRAHGRGRRCRHRADRAVARSDSRRRFRITRSSRCSRPRPVRAHASAARSKSWDGSSRSSTTSSASASVSIPATSSPRDTSSATATTTSGRSTRSTTHVGIENVGAFHLNDSKKPLGSRVDRHQHIGDGEIGVEAFRFLLNDARFRGIPKLLETPKTDRARVGSRRT